MKMRVNKKNRIGPNSSSLLRLIEKKKQNMWPGGDLMRPPTAPFAG